MIINLTNACDQTCTYQADKPDKICFGKAGECMLLKCDSIDNVPYWIRQYNNVNDTIWNASQGILSVYSPYYNSGDIKELLILGLRSIDTGMKSFIATNKNNLCVFNIFAASDKWNGSLSIFDETRHINATDNFNVVLNTFSKRVNFTYQFEALPLDYLTWNNTRLSTDLCEADQSSLSCLIAEDVDLNLEKCTNSFQLDLSYGYNTDFSSFQTIVVRNFTHNLVFRYPPQTSKKRTTVTFIDGETSKDLKCEVECANPKTYTFEFVLINNTQSILLQNATNDTYSYKISPEDEYVEIVCTVYNTIIHDPAYKDESQTRFILTYQTPIEESSGLEPWVIIIIAIASVLILVVVILLIFLVYFLIRRSGSYKKDRKFSDSTLEFDKTDKQRQLNNGLKGNPVYVTSTSMKNINSPSPTQIGRSDANQTIL